MKILYFYQYFSTPKGSWGARVFEFASEWVKAGHEVTVVTSIYSKSDIKATKFIEEQIHNGIKVKVVNILIDNKQSTIKRIWTFIQYALVSTWFAIILPTDVIIASSGPITVGIPGLAAHYIRGRKLVFETRDLWPEGAIELGIIKNRLIKKIAYWFEKKCYNASYLIVALSPGMQNYIQSKHQHPNVVSVTNAANISLFSTPKSKIEIPGLNNRKYAIYTGNIGIVNNSKWLLNAARELKNLGRNDIVILLVGEGQLKQDLQKIADQENIDNFIIHNLIPKNNLVGLVQNSVVSLVPLKGTPVLDTSSPNKFFESLTAGIPVIQNTNGWMKDFLESHKVGFTLDPNNPVLLAKKIIELADNPEIGREIKDRAMSIAKKEFDKDHLATKMLNAIKRTNNN